MKPAVYIHTSSHEILSAKVAHFSHLVFSKNLDAFDIEVIRIEDYPQFTARHGSTLIRNGREAAWYKDVPQSFLPLRFIVPQLMGFQGRAVLTDPDIFAISDIWELLSREMGDKRVISRRPTDDYGFDSSVMLLDCEQLSHWQWDDMMEDVFQKKLDLKDLIRLRFESEEDIGALEAVWNDYDRLDGDTKLLHNTSQKTQPWKTGMPFKVENMNNFYKKKEKKTLLDKLLAYRKKSPAAILKAVKNIAMTGDSYLYDKHPDSNQEEFFLSLLKKALEENFIEPDFVKAEVDAGHVRRDILRAADCVSRSPVEIVDSLKSRAR